MLDFYALSAAVKVTTASLGTASLPGPLAQPTTHAVRAAQSSPGAAALGSLVDQLLAEAELDARELEILTGAEALFARGKKLVARVASTRTAFEGVVKDPSSSGALGAYNGAAASLQQAEQDLADLSRDLQFFQATLTPNWLTPVGQQHDRPVNSWAWRDVFLARRTGAFVAEVQKIAIASTDHEELAFALGALAAEAGNAVGDAFLNHVVGGPRRSHNLRHRLASYWVGAWLRDNAGPIAGTLADLHDELSFGQSNPPKLPVKLKALLEAALTTTYPVGVPPVPDLDLGYRNLLRHLELLDSFGLPPLPDPVDNELAGMIAQAGVSNTGIRTQSGGTGPDGPSPHEPDPPSVETGPKDSKTFCETVLAILGAIGVGILFVFTLGAGAGVSSVAVTSSQLQAWAPTPEALKLVAALFNIQCEMWDALATSLNALQLLGLLYPGPDDLSDPKTFAQFVSIAYMGKGAEYPHREMSVGSDPIVFPTSAIEHPVTFPSPYPVGATPVAFLNGVPTLDKISGIAVPLWTGAFGEHNSFHLKNLNLDSDRGWMAICWQLAAGTSIRHDPVQVDDLSYTGI